MASDRVATTCTFQTLMATFV